LCVAGIEAQELFGCETIAASAAIDYLKLIGLVKGLTEAKSLEFRNAGYLRALDILKRHRPEVEKLALYLIEHRRVGD
jgi:hypothetical protein